MVGFRASMETTCTSLLRELEEIWQETGESEEDKDRMLLELERECQQVYRRKFEEASKLRAQLRHSLAVNEAELAALVASLGEHNLQLQAHKNSASLKKQVALITPLLEELRVEKEERVKQFSDVLSQIKKLSMEISGHGDHNDARSHSVEMEGYNHDLSLRKLNECQAQLQALQKEKSDCLRKVLEHVNEVHSLCGVLGLNFGQTVDEIHPSLQGVVSEKSPDISDFTLDGLNQLVLKLKAEKQARIQKLQETMESLIKLWNLMSSSEQETRPFERLVCIFGSPDQDVLQSGVLLLETINQAQAEVERLTTLKASRMKEIVLKKITELDGICREAHLEPDPSTSLEKCYAMIDSGLVDPSELVANLETQITKAKEEVIVRKELMDKINKWHAACDEENWLEQYNQDENRYAVKRGAHLNLKRAEKARVIVSRIPVMVDNLITRTFTWEEEHNITFLYDGVRLLSILEEYRFTRLHKEEEKRRLQEHKKLQNLLLAEKESIYVSKPSPKRSPSLNRKTNGYRGNVNRNGSMTPMLQRNSGGGTPELLTPRSYSGQQNSYFKRSLIAPRNFLALSKENASASFSGSELGFSVTTQLQI